MLKVNLDWMIALPHFFGDESKFPNFQVFWSKDFGSDFPAASERRITHTTFPMGQERRTIINSFVIRDVKAVDMGVYTCTASNPAGSISWNITLSVLESPRYSVALEFGWFCTINF